MVLDLYVEDKSDNENYSISCAYSGFIMHPETKIALILN